MWFLLSWLANINVSDSVVANGRIWSVYTYLAAVIKCSIIWPRFRVLHHVTPMAHKRRIIQTEEVRVQKLGWEGENFICSCMDVSIECPGLCFHNQGWVQSVFSFGSLN